MASTAIRLIDKFGSDYLINGTVTAKGVETKDVKDLMEKGLIQADERAFLFYAEILVSDLITIEAEQWFTSHVESKRVTNIKVISRIVVHK